MSPERATPSKASERSMSGDEDSDSEQKRLTELKMDINSSTQLRLQKLGEDVAGAVQSAVERVFKENVKVFVVGETLDVAELKRQMASSSLALKHGHGSNINVPESAQGRDLSNTLIVDDLRYQGCAKTQAQWRVPPFKEAFHTKVVNAVLEARDPSYAQGSGVPAMIHSTDVVCVFDLNRSVLVSAMLDPYRPDKRKQGQGEQDKLDKLPQTHDSVLKVCKDEDSIRSRKLLCRGLVDQNEEVHVVTVAKPIVDLVPYAKGKHFQGSSHGNTVGFVVLSPISAEWKETKQEKDKT